MPGLAGDLPTQASALYKTEGFLNHFLFAPGLGDVRQLWSLLLYVFVSPAPLSHTRASLFFFLSHNAELSAGHH